jgi:hypothetical protein
MSLLYENGVKKSLPVSKSVPCRPFKPLLKQQGYPQAASIAIGKPSPDAISNLNPLGGKRTLGVRG